MRALITGIAGQDGSFLAEHLLELGYDVHGIVRRQSVAEHQDSRLDHLAGRIRTYYGDLLDPTSIERIVEDVQPDEVYNLAAQSHVRVSFDVPVFTAQVNGVGAMQMLEACRRHAPGCRFYQASSSEMFGNGCDADGYQRETTPMRPTSPYGIAKVFAYNTVRHYRNAYAMHASNGILFNHESDRRASNFVTAKVVKGAVKIYRGLEKKLLLGNMDAQRDWGHSRDYVRAMHLIQRLQVPGDWVVATGETRSVRDLCRYVFSRLGLNYEDHVEQDPRLLRPEELPYLRGDSARIRALGWRPRYTFESMIDEIIDSWLQRTGGGRLRVA
jgi:GDPmannose 4,6-dehydratase